ncbi:MAG: ABC transporter permease [Acidimicrobiales bacterium]
MTRLANLPAGIRWALYAAVGLLVLTVVQTFGTDDTSRLTASGTSSTMLRWSMVVLLAGLGGLFSERAGIVNIGLEGMLVLGTWFGAWGALQWGPWGGLLLGMVGGGIGGLVHAVATIGFGVDHIISGVAINVIAPGAMRYLSEEIFVGYEGGSVSDSPRVEEFGDFTMPFLAGGDLFGWKSPNILQWLGDKEWFYISDVASFTQGLVTDLSYLTMIALALVPISTWVLWRTRFGLRLRICGERPEAGESLGVDIIRHKYIAVMISGALAGLGGAYIVLELTGFYKENQTAGRGFIGLAALIFGNWRPSGVLVGALLFGYPDGLQLRDLQGNATHALLLVFTIALGAVAIVAARSGKRVDAILSGLLALAVGFWYFTTDSVPTWFPQLTPFVVVLLVLIFYSQRLRMPAADGQPYRKGQS